MSQIKNEIVLHNGYVEIKVTKTGITSYTGSVLIDTEDLQTVGKVRITNSNYAYQCGKRNSNVAHVVLNHKSNKETVVDHINGNRLDNRKINLRVVTQAQNANNRTTSVRNNTGVVGVQLRSNGNYQYYRVTVTVLNSEVINPKNKAKQIISKQFNVNKLGKEVAFNLAKKWLAEKRKEFGYINY